MLTYFFHFPLTILKNSLPVTGLLFTFFINMAVHASPSPEITIKEHLEKATNHIKAHRHFRASDALKEAARLGGAEHPSLHMRLAILYYGLGLIPDAIAEGEKAVNLVPTSKWYRYDLAKFYLVDKQFDEAENGFIALLKLDPGFTLGYYYLAEVYFQKKQYDMAWLSLARASLLGHQGTRLLNKLSPLSSKPTEDFRDIPDNKKLFRFINLSTNREAEAILDDIKGGKIFHTLELEERRKSDSGADFGVIMFSEFRSSVATALRDSTPYATPKVIQTGPDFRVIQEIAPFNPQIWKDLIYTSPAGLDQAEKQEDKLPLRLACFYALKNWKEAWQNADLDTYLSAYSKDFIPAQRISFTEWKEERIKNLTQPEYIRIKLVNPVVETLDQFQVTITFKQIYQTETYRDVVLKTLTMKKETDKWRIINEQVTKTLINN